MGGFRKETERSEVVELGFRKEAEQNITFQERSEDDRGFESILALGGLLCSIIWGGTMNMHVKGTHIDWNLFEHVCLERDL